MDVTIYIDVYFTGYLKRGTGIYTIVLEYINPRGITKTKEYVQGLKGTTKNRTELMACIVALGHIIKTCNIRLITNSQFVVNAINQNWNKTKNADLWQQLLELMGQQHITFEYQFANTYSTYMFFEKNKAAKEEKIEYQEDIQIK